MGKKRKSKKVYGKDTHYWRQEMKPLLLAAACVDIAVKHSKEAEAIYEEIIDAWDRPDCQALLKDNIALPVTEIRAWEKAVTKGNEYESDLDIWTETYEGYRQSDDFRHLFDRISEFVKVGFNRRGQSKVIASLAPYLCIATVIWTAGRYIEKSLNWDMPQYLELGEKKLEISNFINGGSRRMHDFHVPLLKMYGYRLRQDGTMKDISWYWYQSRVVYSGTEEFYREYYKKEDVYLDSRNVNRMILECDKQRKASKDILERNLRGYVYGLAALAMKSLPGSDVAYGKRYAVYFLENLLEDLTFEQEVQKRKHKYDSMEY